MGMVSEMLPLREELQLYPGPTSRTGAPTWTILDPGNNRFFRMGWLAFEIISRWHLGTPKAIAVAVRAETTLDPGTEGVLAVIQHLIQSDLLRVTGDAAMHRLEQKARFAKGSWMNRLLKNYLFIRIPLVRPDRFLERAMPALRWFFSRQFLWAVVLIALLGFTLVFQQWDLFVATFLDFFSPQWIVYYGAALVVAKSAHELGHALTARHFGCRVPTMGVAFLVMWPVLYTETSDAWKLPALRPRLAVGAAGILAELAVAAVATLAWNFLPEGPARNAAFLLATTTWLLTLAVNLNPLLRFDGYFLLSDLLELPNLQDRAFAMGRWFLRERLFGLGEPAPEGVSRGQGRFMVFFAFTVWIYRFFLFFGIALLVYHFFFKMLGMFLFVVEIGWFILFPVAREVKVWAGQREKMRMNGHVAVSGLVSLVLLTAFFFPWDRTVEAPATLRAERHTVLYTRQAARLETPMPRVGTVVRKGDLLFRFSDPGLDYRQARVDREITLLRWKIGAGGVEASFRQQDRALRRELAARISELAAIRKEQARLTVTTPFSGTLVERLADASPGDWLGHKEPLVTLVDREGVMIEAFVNGDEPGIVVGSVARFIPEDLQLPTLPCRVKIVDHINTPRLREPYLASRFGGGVAVREDPGGAWVPQQVIFRLVLEPVGNVGPLLWITRGTAVIETPSESPAASLWKGVIAVLIRESGF